MDGVDDFELQTRLPRDLLSIRFRRDSMKMQVAAEIVARWAQSEPLILRIYFFGSRVKGRYLPESDLDVAIVLDPRCLPEEDTDGVITWFANMGRWHKCLQERLPVPLDLEWHHPRRTAASIRGVAEASLLVYEKPSRTSPEPEA